MREIRRVKVDGQDAGHAEVIPPGSPEGVQSDPIIALVAQFMDSAFRVPGTGIRFGLDPVLGLLPGLGDGAGTFVSITLIGMSARYRVPKIVLVRMALNAAINGVVGTIPVAGDAFSLWFKSNQRNYELLQKHASERKVSTLGDWLFVGALMLMVALAVLVAFSWVFAFWIFLFRLIF